MTRSSADTATATAEPKVPLALRPYIERWAVSGEGARIAARKSASPRELMQFHDAMTKEFDGLIQELGDLKVPDLSPSQQTLLNLLLSFVEVSQTIEVFGVELPPPRVYPDHLITCVI